MELSDIQGQPSWKVQASASEAWITRLGAQVAPVKFQLEGRTIEPLAIAPWAEESHPELPPILQALRGDFFCMPFGHDVRPYAGEVHPLHGEPANEPWEFEAQQMGGGLSSIRLSLKTKVRPATITKHVSLRDDETNLYQRHDVKGLSGPMSFGTHAMLRFNSPGLLSASPIAFGQVLPGKFEDPARGGYSSLQSGTEFRSLDAVQTATGGIADLTTFPAREGYEDLVQIASEPGSTFAWSAVSFPEEEFVFFQLKDPRVLTGTILWFSNGGRHYSPWNGRHRGVMGIEEATTYFHMGLRMSVSPNPLQALGIPTYRNLAHGETLSVRTVLGVAATPPGFDRVAHIEPDKRGVILVSDRGLRVAAPVWMGFFDEP